MKSFEYQLLQCSIRQRESRQAHERDLNELAREGWRVVHVVGNHESIAIVLEREADPLPAEEQRL